MAIVNSVDDETPEMSKAKEFLSRFFNNTVTDGYSVIYTIVHGFKCSNSEAFAFVVHENKSKYTSFEGSAADYCTVYVFVPRGKKVFMYGREQVYYSNTRYPDSNTDRPHRAYSEIISCEMIKRGSYAVKIKTTNGEIYGCNSGYDITKPY